MADNLKREHCCKADMLRQIVDAEAGTATVAAMDSVPDLVVAGR